MTKLKEKTEKERMYAAIQQHGENLNAIFNTGLEPVALCKKLRRLESEAHKLATDYCNGENGIDTENWDEKITPVMQKVYKLLGNGIYGDARPYKKKVPIYLNGDARGYALKINDAYVIMLRKEGKTIYTDFGGYGILAPDFTRN